ncbi:MAG: polysaccharide biosynthesis/export family protein [candidate division Zixibacteria bacterium]|nr:polysaccharide biosynthesis/export family protein [candidate division Zixibacteria bacterium]
MKTMRFYLLGGLLLMFLSPVAGLAEYTIGVDDVLEVVFWQKKELNQIVTVNAEGKITLSVTGEITAAGLTPSQLGRKIVEHVSRFDRSISQAVVTVKGYFSRTVFVEGEVVKPGRFAREVVPDLWTIIKERGGVTEFGDLRNVKVIRGGQVDQGKVITLDVLEAVTSKNIAALPRIYPHDIVRISRLPSGLSGGGIPVEAGKRRNEFYITGAVAQPGRYTLEPGMDLLEAIVVAGGHSASANLKKVKITSKLDHYATVYSIDLDRQIKRGDIPRYIVQAEDAIVVPQRKSGLFGASLGVLRDVAAFGGTITSIVLLIDRLAE